MTAFLRVFGVALAPSLAAVLGAFMIFLSVSSMVDIHAVTPAFQNQESTATHELLATTAAASKGPTTGFTGTIGELYDHLLETVANFQEDSPTRSSSRKVSKAAAQDFYEEMKEKLWALNEESIIQKLIQDGILEPSYGDQYKLNYVPTYMDEDLFTGIFSSQEESASTEKAPGTDEEKETNREKKKTRDLFLS